MTHPFVVQKQLNTIKLFGRLPQWRLIIDKDSFGGYDSLYGSPFIIGDELGLVTVMKYHGWAIDGIKKSELSRFLNEYTLAKGYIAPRYVPKV